MDDVTREVSNLSKLEERLVLEQDVISLRGKRGKYVPVIVPSYTKLLLKYLADEEVRKQAGISRSNMYVFASSGAGVLRGGHCLREMAEAAGLEKPLRIRSTKMRRFMATMTQLMDISVQEQRWIVDHMGHTMDIHNIYYKSTLDVIERVDMTKLLLIMDMGKLGKYKGQQIQDIDLEDILETPQGGEEATEDQEEEEEYVPELAELEQDNVDEAVQVFPARRKNHHKRQVKNRHKWTSGEIKELEERFKDEFMRDTTPGQKAVDRSMKDSKREGGEIWKLPLTSIKSKVSWMRLHPRPESKKK